MREIATLLGKVDTPIEVDIPKDLVRTFLSTFRLWLALTRAISSHWPHRRTLRCAAYNDHVKIQCYIPIRCSIPSSSHDECPRRMAIKAERKTGSRRWYALFCAGLVTTISCFTPKLGWEETEKYAHVTFFFNGGVEKQYPNEDRHMIPSPKVPTYDLDPGMSVQSVADKVVEILKKGEHEFVMCNFAPPDMVRRKPLLRSRFIQSYPAKIGFCFVRVFRAID